VRSITDLINVSYVRQKEPLGLGHAILVARDLSGRRPFAVFLGDDIIESRVPVMRQMIDVHERCGSSVVAVERVSRERTSDYGIVAGRSGRRGGSKAGAGCTASRPGREARPEGRPVRPGDHRPLHPDAGDLRASREDARRARGEIQLTDGLRSLLRKQEIHAYSFEGTRYDTGDRLGFLKATVEFALRRPDLGRAFRDYLRGLDLDGFTAAPDPAEFAARVGPIRRAWPTRRPAPAREGRPLSDANAAASLRASAPTRAPRPGGRPARRPARRPRRRCRRACALAAAASSCLP